MMSTPRTISGFSDDASTSGSSTKAGRRLANRPRSFRSLRMPSSGRWSKGSLSHFGPPTLPNSTASATFARATVASEQGVPSASIAAPPTRPSSSSKVRLRRRSSHSITRRVSRITSGPMPSPGSTSRRLLEAMAVLPSGAVKPGLRGFLLRLEAVDRGHVLQGLADIIEPVQQQVAAQRVDLEGDFLTGGPHHHLTLEIDGDAGIAAEFGILDELLANGTRQLHRQHAVLEAVVVE